MDVMELSMVLKHAKKGTILFIVTHYKPRMQVTIQITCELHFSL